MTSASGWAKLFYCLSSECQSSLLGRRTFWSLKLGCWLPFIGSSFYFLLISILTNIKLSVDYQIVANPKSSDLRSNFAPLFLTLYPNLNFLF